MKTPSNREILASIKEAIENMEDAPNVQVHPEEDSLQIEYQRAHDVDVFTLELKYYWNFAG